ncbi:MAG: toxic anion resistance protein [Halomonadaceae bacterium]|jgi:uncharacterized protein YaaN involved in tellurite resistance|nr:toxic anion resistance protein [Halomonas sp. MCCC 1A11062]
MERNHVQPPLGTVKVISSGSEADEALIPGQDDTALAEQARATVESLLETNPDDRQARDEARNAIENMSRKLQVEAARKSAMLNEPIRTLSQRAEDGGPVANALMDLKVQVESLDPARHDLSPNWFGRLARGLPFVSSPIKRYFMRYETSASIIGNIVESLEQGREQLKRDNITLQSDQDDMREITGRLSRAIELGRQIDALLTSRLENEVPQDDPRYAFIQEELLFPLRQRIQDLQQQLAVNQQGVLTTEIIIRNNKELIRGVNRSTTVTVNALQIAVTLALALANQKIVLDKVEAVNQVTDSLIANTATQLRQQGAAIHQRAASTQLNIDTLQQAFADIDAALTDISQFRRQALPTMAESIGKMAELSRTTEAAIERMDKARHIAVALEIEAN